MKLYQSIAQAWQARENCEANAQNKNTPADNLHWRDMIVRHADRLNAMVKECMPSGSGFDNGTTLDYGATRPNRLVFNTAFHHMNDAGMYDGWSEHQVIVCPSLVYGFELRVTGRDRRRIKDYIHECFHIALDSELPKE